MISEQLTEIYQLLLDRFGPQHWWPGETQFEIVTGAVLTQNTAWPNVEKAIGNLKTANLLTPEKLHNIQTPKLAEFIKPAGYFNIKAKRLKNFLSWLFENYNGQLTSLQSVDTSRLRPELLAIKGIGPETADSILLYAFDREIFVVDAYTARVAVRHGLIEPLVDYDKLQQLSRDINAVSKHMRGLNYEHRYQQILLGPADSATTGSGVKPFFIHRFHNSSSPKHR